MSVPALLREKCQAGNPFLWTRVVQLAAVTFALGSFAFLALAIADVTA